MIHSRILISSIVFLAIVISVACQKAKIDDGEELPGSAATPAEQVAVDIQTEINDTSIFYPIPDIVLAYRDSILLLRRNFIEHHQPKKSANLQNWENLREAIWPFYYKATNPIRYFYYKHEFTEHAFELLKPEEWVNYGIDIERDSNRCLIELRRDFLDPAKECFSGDEQELFQTVALYGRKRQFAGKNAETKLEEYNNNRLILKAYEKFVTTHPDLELKRSITYRIRFRSSSRVFLQENVYQNAGREYYHYSKIDSSKAKDYVIDKDYLTVLKSFVVEDSSSVIHDLVCERFALLTDSTISIVDKVFQNKELQKKIELKITSPLFAEDPLPPSYTPMPDSIFSVYITEIENIEKNSLQSLVQYLDDLPEHNRESISLARTAYIYTMEDADSNTENEAYQKISAKINRILQSSTEPYRRYFTEVRAPSYGSAGHLTEWSKYGIEFWMLYLEWSFKIDQPFLDTVTMIHSGDWKDFNQFTIAENQIEWKTDDSLDIQASHMKLHRYEQFLKEHPKLPYGTSGGLASQMKIFLTAYLGREYHSIRKPILNVNNRAGYNLIVDRELINSYKQFAEMDSNSVLSRPILEFYNVVADTTLPDSELYQNYEKTRSKALHHLSEEIDRLHQHPPGWGEGC